MLNFKKPVQKVMLAVALVLALVCFFATLWGFTSKTISSLVSTGSICALIAIVAAFYYVFMGFKKNAALYYKFFTAFTAASALATLVGAGTVDKDYQVASLICAAFSFAFLMAITVCKDLGEKNSYVCCGITFVAQLGLIVTTGLAGFDSLVMARMITNAVLTLLLFIMTTAKYIDKAERKAAKEAEAKAE